MVRDDFEVVWYMEERSSREAGVAEVADFGAPFMVVALWVGGLVPGCNDWSPRGVSRMTRK
jgi:hypothetical protein